jgi:hypothetical protein
LSLLLLLLRLAHYAAQRALCARLSCCPMVEKPTSCLEHTAGQQHGFVQ